MNEINNPKWQWLKQKLKSWVASFAKRIVDYNDGSAVSDLNNLWEDNQGGMVFVNANASDTNGAPPKNANVIAMTGLDGGAWQAQLAVTGNPAESEQFIWYRAKNASSWGDWKLVFPARRLYDNTGSRATSADWESDGIAGGLLTTLATTSMVTNKPTMDGVILTLPWDRDGWHAQLFVANNRTNNSPILAHRYKNNTTWTNWEYLPRYRIGDVIITSTNTNPTNFFGGTWELIDKEFTDVAQNSTTNGTYFTINTTNVTSIAGCYLWRSGHTLRMELRLNVKVALTDTAVALGTLNLSALGVTSTGRSIFSTAVSDAGNGIAIIHSTTAGAIEVLDVITKASNGTIPAGQRLDFDLIIPHSKGTMLDSACNKFYWKRTA